MYYVEKYKKYMENINGIKYEKMTVDNEHRICCCLYNCSNIIDGLVLEIIIFGFADDYRTFMGRDIPNEMGKLYYTNNAEEFINNNNFYKYPLFNINDSFSYMHIEELIEELKKNQYKCIEEIKSSLMEGKNDWN